MKKILLIIVFSLGIYSVFAQSKQISGKVTSSEDGSTIPGVSVSIKGSSVGTVTDNEGQFTLQVPDEAEALIFSFVGLRTREIPITSETNYNIVLEPEVYNVDEVVVTALGIKRNEKAIGYATQKVSGEDLVSAPEQNIVNSLGGRISGVHITNSSGSVGASSRIILRGASSIYGNNQPLFVIDGIPISNDNEGTTTGSGGFDLPNGVADINPNDIESVNVLKGPSAAALYGVRASNGVIVVTTKTGRKSQALGVEINQTFTFDSPLVIPDFQNSYGQGSSKDFFEYVNGTSGDGGVDESWGPPLDVGLEFVQFTSYIKDPNNPQPQPWVSHPNNVRDFYETGVTSKSDISISGGNEKTTFRFGTGYSDQEGMIPFTDFRKLNIDGKASHEISERLKANFGARYIKSDSDNLPNSGYDGSNVVQQTVWSGRNVDLQALKNWRNLPKALPGSVYGEGILPLNWNTAFQNNPYWQLEMNQNTFNRTRFIGNMGLSYDITSYLNVSGHAGVDNYRTKTSVKWHKGSAGDAPTYWRYSGNRNGADGFYDEDHRTFNETNMDLLLNFDRQIFDDFYLSATLGGSRMHRETTFNYSAIQLELPGLFNLGNLRSGTSMFNINEHAQSSINSVFGSAEFSFKEYLFLSVTGRNDWASVLPLANNSFFYPSATLSALLNDIFDINSDKLNYLKIRGGWAEVGGFGPLGAGDILPVYGLSSLPWNGNTFAYFPSTLNNTNIKAQSVSGFEGGLELRMFSNRLRLDATYYDQTSEDLVLPVQVTSSSGVRSVWDNVGELNNKGIEIQLGATLMESKDFSVNLDLNFGANNNKVIKAGKDESNDEETLVLGYTWDMNLEAREGYPYGVIVGSSLARTDDGQVIFENGIPVMGEQQVLGDIQPDWTGGVNLGIRYKNLALNTLVDAKMGGELYSMTIAWGMYSGILEETLIGRETGIIGEGVKNIGTDENPEYVPNDVVVSAETWGHNAYGNNIVETSVFDASYVKLRQVALSYSFPKKWTSAIGLQGANLSLIGRNLAILYKKVPHIDPETGFDNSNAMQGQEFGQLPSARTVGVGLNVKF